MKLSVNKTNLTGLWAKNRDIIQQVLILKFSFRPLKLSALSRNRPDAVFLSTRGSLSFSPGWKLERPWKPGWVMARPGSREKNNRPRQFILKIAGHLDIDLRLERLYDGHLRERRKWPLLRGFKQESMYGFFSTGTKKVAVRGGLTLARSRRSKPWEIKLDKNEKSSGNPFFVQAKGTC